MNRQLFSDLALTVSRVVLGVVFVAHGWQKLMTNGLDATAAGFSGMGVPLPSVSAGVAGAIELVGGIALLAGAFTSVAGLALALVMAGAVWFAHLGNGVFVADGGWELPGALAAGALALAATGPGPLSVDGLLARRMDPSDRTRPTSQDHETSTARDGARVDA